jgi:hypothetical protein
MPTVGRAERRGRVRNNMCSRSIILRNGAVLRSAASGSRIATGSRLVWRVIRRSPSRRTSQ